MLSHSKSLNETIKRRTIMNNRMPYKGLILGTTALLSLSFAHTASATPAFSRQIHADCRTCHFQNMNALNKFGRMFELNAFHLSNAMKAELKKKRNAKEKQNQDKQQKAQAQSQD